VTVVAATLAALAVWTVLSVPADARCRALADAAARPEPMPEPDPGSGRLAATFDLVAAALDAGLPPAQALTTVATAMPSGLRVRTQRVAAMLDLADEPRAVWELLATDATLGPLGTALARADASGAPVAEAVRVLADELRRTDRTDRLERARRVGVRTAAPLGLCFLPAFLLVAVIPTVIGLIGTVF
jgi:Flp pilus assembly protein TadB